MTNSQETSHTALRNSLGLIPASQDERTEAMVTRLRENLTRLLPVAEAHASGLDHGTLAWDQAKADIDLARRALADTDAANGQTTTADYQLQVLAHASRMLLAAHR